ncbi:hypothetical protein BE20_08640 [Sorangium cellulosum]|nr:hypothetical protein BE20_08640 [Sorangium cellulosum]
MAMATAGAGYGGPDLLRPRPVVPGRVRGARQPVEAQSLTYLRLPELKLALVINFGEVKVRQGIHRVVMD